MKTNKALFRTLLILIICIIALSAFILFYSTPNQHINEEFNELKKFTSVEKSGPAQTYSNEAIEKYVHWSYGDEWNLVEENAYGETEKALKFTRQNGDYFHTIIGYSYGTQDIDDAILPDHNHYTKSYRDTYEYEILKNHQEEIEKLAKQLSINAEITVEDRSPATNAYIIIDTNNANEFQNIATFMVRASEIVNYNINPDMHKSKMGLNVTVILSGKSSKAHLSLAKNQATRNIQDAQYYLNELNSQILNKN